MNSSNNLKIDLTVVVPVYNSAATLHELYLQIRDVLRVQGIVFELLFVNDAGPDDSLKILSDMVGKYAEVSVVNMQHNVGQYAAILHGLRFARGKCCVVMDADLQDPPQALGDLWCARSEKCKAVFASRYGKFQSFSRMISSRIYKTLLYCLVGLPRNTGVFVLLEREMVEALLSMPVVFPSINVMIGLSKLPLCVIPVKRNSREQGESAYSSWTRLRSAMRSIFCAVSYRVWQSDNSYLEHLDNDPVEWVRLCKL